MAKANILLAGLAIAVALSACATASSPLPKTWAGGDPAHLASDETACHKDTDNVGLGANGYSDSRYGVASALAEAVDRDDPMKSHASDARAAAFITCMSDKGWHPG